MLQSTNQRCNALQSVIGLYLHACDAPEAIIDLLSRNGVAISRTAIDDAVTNLSKEANIGMKKLGRTLLAMVAYDNFDVELKHLVPTVEKPHDSLLHMTSGTFIPMEHGVTVADLCGAEKLWKESPDNPENRGQPEQIDWTKLLTIHPQVEHPSGLDRRERFQVWQFKFDLYTYGPEYFRRFLAKLGEPEDIERIPLVKTRQVPAQAMDVNQSSVDGNIEALQTLFQQLGIGDPSDKDDHDQAGRRDIGDHVILVHGDLATCERVQSIRLSRGEEKTTFRRFAMVIFVIALFHLKMACADAIWKIFIQPPQARLDNTSLMKQIAEIRPKETGKIGSKPGFRRMHEVIQHVGIVSRLDCWRHEVASRNLQHPTLEAWAESEPSEQDIEEIASVLVKKYVADARLTEERFAAPDLRDEQFENVRLRESYFLLYEELSRAMNAGDIGRVEDCFLPWVFIFKGCGKSKYAVQMIRFLYNLYYVYTPPLRSVIASILWQASTH